MNTSKFHNEPYRDDSGRRTFGLMGFARFLACAGAALMATSAPSILADAQVYGYVGPTGQMSLTNVSTDEQSRQFAARPGIT